MNRYVKKPIAIEAVKWKGFNNDEIKDFAGDQYGRIRTFLQEVLPVFCSDTYDIYMNILLDSLLIRFNI